jgi:anaerobic magnesium-protoporphyrin IX monomethyl ester cyclase
VAYIAGQLKAAGYRDIRFIDAMTDHIENDALEAISSWPSGPDVVLCTAITPAIYKAQETLALVKRIHPDAVTVLGGIHGTFMYGQVLSEAPWIDYIIRGEGEEIVVELHQGTG